MINLEKFERLIIAFLIIALLAGLGVSVYKKLRPMVDVKVDSFDAGVYENADKNSAAIATEEKIDINRASAEDLIAINGIGPVLAERIVSYRQSIGRFNSIDEIKKVRGIGDYIFDKIRLRISAE